MEVTTWKRSSGTRCEPVRGSASRSAAVCGTQTIRLSSLSKSSTWFGGVHPVRPSRSTAAQPLPAKPLLVGSSETRELRGLRVTFDSSSGCSASRPRSELVPAWTRATRWGCVHGWPAVLGGFDELGGHRRGGGARPGAHGGASGCFEGRIAVVRSVVDGLRCGVDEASSRAAALQGDELGHDGDGGLLGGFGAEVEADG